MHVGVSVEKDRVCVVATRRGRIAWAAESSYVDASDLSVVLAALSAERPRAARRARVVLSADLARVKTVEGLPRLNRADLAAHVRLNSRRYFLQNGVPLVTDAIPVAVNGAQSGALCAGAPTPLVEAIATGLQQAGISCDAVVPGALVSATTPPESVEARLRDAYRAATGRLPQLSLLPATARACRETAQRRALKRWGLACAISFLLAGASWYAGQRRAEIRANGELADMKAAVDQALAIRANLDDTQSALDQLGHIGGKPLRGRFLATLTRAMPDSAFIVALRLEPDGTGSLSGYAPRAAALLATLERSGVLIGARLDGPVNREVVAGRELERFALRFRLPPRSEEGRSR